VGDDLRGRLLDPLDDHEHVLFADGIGDRGVGNHDVEHALGYIVVDEYSAGLGVYETLIESDKLLRAG